MNRYELFETVRRWSAEDVARTSPILSTTLNQARRYPEDEDIAPLLLQSLIYACKDLDTLTKELTDLHSRTARPVIIIPGGKTAGPKG